MRLAIITVIGIAIFAFTLGLLLHPYVVSHLTWWVGLPGLAALFLLAVVLIIWGSHRRAS